MNKGEQLRDAASPRLVDRLAEWRLGNADLFVIPTDVRDVVTIRGSFETNPDLARNDDLLQSFVMDLLDKGTQKHDRFEIAEMLEGRGAQVSFYSNALRSGFIARMLREDVDTVLSLIKEQLVMPLFGEEEFLKSRNRAIASVRRSMDSTSSQAGGALKRALYPKAHPNYVHTPEEEVADLESTDLNAVSEFHASHFGCNNLKLAVVGDVEANEVFRLAEAHFGEWHSASAMSSFETGALSGHAPGEPLLTLMTDKPNLDVQIAHSVPLRRDSDDFLPLYVGTFVLGGNFSSRLMQTIRDAMGLTYGIRSSLSGITVDHDGHWKTSVSLSQSSLDVGIKATLKVIRQFVDEGVTSEELEGVKTTLTGSHVVGLATTGGLAARLLVNAERDFPTTYLDDYPSLVEALTLDQVNGAIRQYLNPDRLAVSIAGTLPG